MVRLTGAVVVALAEVEAASEVVVDGMVVAGVDEVDVELTVVGAADVGVAAGADEADGANATDVVAVVLGGNVVVEPEVVTRAEVVVLAGAGSAVVGATDVVTAASGTSASVAEVTVEVGAAVVLL